MKIALDLGNRNTKIAWPVNNHIQTETFTSMFGRGRTRNLGSLESGLNKTEITGVHDLTYDNISQVIGHNTHLHVQNIDGFTHQRFDDGITLKPLAYAALAHLPLQTNEVSAVFGLPISVMETSGEKTMRGIRKWLGGSHSFTFDGQNRTIRVNKIQGLAQPLGTWARFMFNDLGEWIHDKQAPCIVIDLGFYTLDIYMIENRKVTPRHTIGENAGIYLAAGNLCKQIKAEFDLTITLHQADLLLKNYLEHNKTVFYHPKGSGDIDELISSAVGDTFLEHNRIIASVIKNAQYRYLIGSGGGILYHASSLQTEYPNIRISRYPITDNAAGLAIMAQKLF